jgi:hypothetical protein
LTLGTVKHRPEPAGWSPSSAARDNELVQENTHDTFHRAPERSCAGCQDLADQARPGHGVPSQDTDPAAQQPLTPREAEREANSVLAGGGVMVGAAAGAALGGVLAGPVGAVVAGTAGAVVGALGGVAAGPLVSGEDAVDPKKVPVDKRTTSD